MHHMSAATRIRSRLGPIVDGLAQLTKTVSIQRMDRGSGAVVYLGPEYYWGELSAEQRAAQFSLKRDYDALSELLAILMHGAPTAFAKQLQSADKGFRIWLEFGHSNWSLSPNGATNEKGLREAAGKLEPILAVLDKTGKSDVILIPDTNSLLAVADPTAYRGVAGSNSFTFVLLPAVMGELDRLKVEHRNEDVREKAKKVIIRIKGWRQQGSLMNGVTVDKSITVKASHSEPGMKATLSWLDADVQDDRIVASVLALQSDHPSACIILVTGDVNLLNKADAALIATVELP